MDIDKLDIAKLKPTSVNLSRLSNVVKNDVVEKDVYDELVKKGNAIQTNDTSNLVKKTDSDIKIDEFEKNTPKHDKYITTTEFDKVNSRKFC